MSLNAEQLDLLECLSGEQVKALMTVFEQVITYFETQLLGCSLGEVADSVAQQKIVALKYRHEGALKARQLFQTELQRIREGVQKRMAASNAAPRSGKK